MNRARPDHDQQPIIVAVKNALNDRPRLGDASRLRFADGQFLAQLARRRERLFERDVKIGDFGVHGVVGCVAIA